MSRPVLQVIDGGRGWLEELYTRYAGAVYARCRYLLRNDAAAEDAMHEVFARALIKRDGLKGEDSVLGWLMSIATRHCLNVLRAEGAGWKQRYATVRALDGEAHGGTAELEARDQVRAALAHVDVETQQAAIHHFVDEMTLEEVARLLGRSVPTIRKRLRAFCQRSGQVLTQDLERP